MSASPLAKALLSGAHPMAGLDPPIKDAGPDILVG
jgi:hypothetical protein